MGHTTGEQPGLPYQNSSTIAGRGCRNPQQELGNLHCLSKEYDTDAYLMRLNAARYWVGEGDNGEPTLFREDLVNGTNEMVPGIENITILWGVDTDNDRIPDEYQRGYVADWNNVVSARVGVLARTQAQTKFSTADEAGTDKDTQSYDLDGDGEDDLLIAGLADARVQRRLYSATVLMRNIQ